jgi:hypothetical protein
VRALVWITEESWEATIAAAQELVPAGAEITLLHVADADVEALARGARSGLLGRARGPEGPPPMREISESAARALLADAAARLGRSASQVTRRGRVEHEVVSAAAGADLLVLARGGDRTRPGPRSIGHAARFVIDHATCRLLIV